MRCITRLLVTNKRSRTMTGETAPLVYSVREACRISSLGRTRLYQLINSGQLEVTRLGRRTLVNAASLHRLLLPDSSSD